MESTSIQVETLINRDKLRTITHYSPRECPPKLSPYISSHATDFYQSIFCVQTDKFCTWSLCLCLNSLSRKVTGRHLDNQKLVALGYLDEGHLGSCKYYTRAFLERANFIHIYHMYLIVFCT